MCRLGHEVVLVVDQGGNMNFLDFKPHANLTIKTWPNPRPVGIKDYLFFYNLCRSFKPDVVLSQFSSNTIALLVSRLFPQANFFVFWHTMQVQITTDMKSSGLKYRLLMFRKNIVFRISNFYFLTNSQDLKKEISAIFPYHKHEPRVLHYLMPDPLQFKKIIPFDEREYCISFVSRLDKSKGHKDFLFAYAKLLSFFPALKLKIVGSGPELSDLTNVVSDLGIKDNVLFMGECNYSSVLSIMATSLIHVSNSKQEAFGMVNVEAISLGTPILANKVGGIKEILEPGINGEFIDVQNFDDFHKKIAGILSEHEWDNYSISARKVFLSRFNGSDSNFEKQIKILLS